MDKEQAWHLFMSSFGWDAYDENTTPSDANFPRITYETITDNIGNAVYPSASLWTRSSSWEGITQKAHEIAEELGQGGTTIKFDDGVMWVVQGSPFAQRMSDEDPAIRRILLNFAVEYISAV